jgi:hypothetical protein
MIAVFGDFGQLSVNESQCYIICKIKAFVPVTVVSYDTSVVKKYKTNSLNSAGLKKTFVSS